MCEKILQVCNCDQNNLCRDYSYLKINLGNIGIKYRNLGRIGSNLTVKVKHKYLGDDLTQDHFILFSPNKDYLL